MHTLRGYTPEPMPTRRAAILPIILVVLVGIGIWICREMPTVYVSDLTGEALYIQKGGNLESVSPTTKIPDRYNRVVIGSSQMKGT